MREDISVATLALVDGSLPKIVFHHDPLLSSYKPSKPPWRGHPTSACPPVHSQCVSLSSKCTHRLLRENAQVLCWLVFQALLEETLVRSVQEKGCFSPSSDFGLLIYLLCPTIPLHLASVALPASSTYSTLSQQLVACSSLRSIWIVWIKLGASDMLRKDCSVVLWPPTPLSHAVSDVLVIDLPLYEQISLAGIYRFPQRVVT